MKQATFWQAQLVDNTIMRGGQQHYYPNQPIVEMIPIEAMKLFSLVHNTYSDSYFVPWDSWYINRVASNVAYPFDYQMADGSILTVDLNEETGMLLLTQNYEG